MAKGPHDYLFHEFCQAHSGVDERVNGEIKTSGCHQVEVLKDGQSLNSRRQAGHVGSLLRLLQLLLLDLGKRDDTTGSEIF